MRAASIRIINGLAIGFILIFSLNTSALAKSNSRTPPVRALHFVLWGASVSDAIRIIDLAKSSRFNTLVIALGDAVNFRSFPGKPRADAWSVDQLLMVVQYAKNQGFNVIPDIRLLTHQESFFGGNHPDLMFNSYTYDPRKLEVYRFVNAYLDEVVALLHPTAIHIAHDEVIGWDQQHFASALKVGEVGLPADLFIEDVKYVHAYLKKRRIDIWMWGDMLIAPDEFPMMMSKVINGGIPGYGRDLRKRLPKDIVICDWHYYDGQKEFPSLDAFSNEGFKVLGATWKNTMTTDNFSHYAASHGAIGMVATTWFHVQRKEWDVVERIIRESGDAFSKDFPDAEK